jgi:hypothetical protein
METEKWAGLFTRNSSLSRECSVLLVQPTRVRCRCRGVSGERQRASLVLMVATSRFSALLADARTHAELTPGTCYTFGYVVVTLERRPSPIEVQFRRVLQGGLRARESVDLAERCYDAIGGRRRPPQLEHRRTSTCSA